VKYLLASHGPLAKAAIESAQMIVGAVDNLQAVTVSIDSTLESTIDEIKKILDSCKNEEWIIITDIIGGTPFNASYRILDEYSNILLVTGLNLPMLLELLMSNNKSIGDCKLQIENMKDTVISIVEKVSNHQIEDDSEYDL
jgi:PTS system fructose subfamily IIA component